MVELNGNTKRKWGKKHSTKPNQTIQAYYDNVNSFDRTELQKILKKFQIKANQEPAKSYYKKELINHPAIINNITEENREHFVCSLLGYISSILIKSTEYIWEIDIDRFRENLQAYLKQYQINELRFPNSNVSVDTASIKDKTCYQFVKELKNIEYERKIGKSMEHYLKASDSQTKMIELRKSLAENLDNYDEDIKDRILELKDSHIDQLNKQSNLFECSRRFYDDSINTVSPLTKIEGVTPTRPYYPKGRLLHNIEIKTIKLNLENESE